MKKNKKLFIIIGIILGVILIGGGIFILTNKKTSKPIIPKKTSNQKKEEEPKITIVDENSSSRPYAVMINNHNDARLVQSGLSKAYIVYELVAEGGITRFLALFKDVDLDRIGSVRSSRHYYLDYVLENDAIYVHWGWSPQAQSDIRTLGINNINGLTYEGVYFYRENPIAPQGISTEHTGFTNSELLAKAVDKLKYRTETTKDLLLKYSAKSIDFSKYEEAEDATNITIKYSGYITNKYEYDENSKVYNRFVNGKEQIDKNTEKQLTVKNIIVYFINNHGIAGDQKGRQDLDNIGTGTGYYISEGKIIKINWEKKSREEQTKYTIDADGTPLIVNDGNTFIQIVPKTGSIDWE